jgi:hypothetical protein
MSKDLYEVIRVKKPIDGSDLVKAVVSYITSRTRPCPIETDVEGNTYTILIAPPKKSAKNSEQKKGAIVIQLILQNDTCSVSYKYSNARSVADTVVAAAMVPLYLPAAGIIMGATGIKMLKRNNFKKEIINFIRTYVS